LGLWDGGSTAFWFELLKPHKYVGIDKAERKDSDYFRTYVASRGIADRIKTYWSTDQTDSEKFQGILKEELGASLNLVIDDASHQYEATKKSFEILFPYMEAGGLYIIEDWAWGHWSEFQAELHPWADKPPLTNLVFELVEAIGSWQSGAKLIESIRVFQGFAAVERGSRKVENPHAFRLQQYISRRPPTSSARRAVRKVKYEFDRYVAWRFRPK
jgi:hypothetical protein